jgi:hypothetical protein
VLLGGWDSGCPGVRVRLIEGRSQTAKAVAPVALERMQPVGRLSEGPRIEVVDTVLAHTLVMYESRRA